MQIRLSRHVSFFRNDLWEGLMNPTTRCDTCQVSAEFLETSSALSSFVDYFRCPQCGLVWTQPKSGFGGERKIISVRDQNEEVPGDRIVGSDSFGEIEPPATVRR